MTGKFVLWRGTGTAGALQFEAVRGGISFKQWRAKVAKAIKRDTKKDKRALELAAELRKTANKIYGGRI